jgi:hypothetical protein
MCTESSTRLNLKHPDFASAWNSSQSLAVDGALHGDRQAARSRHTHIASERPLTIQYQPNRYVAAEESHVLYAQHPRSVDRQHTPAAGRRQQLLHSLLASLSARDYTFFLTGCN